MRILPSLHFPGKMLTGEHLKLSYILLQKELGGHVPWRRQRRQYGVICRPPKLVPSSATHKPEITGNKAGLFSFCLFFFTSLYTATQHENPAYGFTSSVVSGQNAKDRALRWNQSLGEESRRPPAMMKTVRIHDSQGLLLRWCAYSQSLQWGKQPAFRDVCIKGE